MRKIVFAVLLCLVLSASCAFAQEAVHSDKRLITVSGEAQVNVVPDEIIVNIGVQAAGDTASQARDKEAILARSLMALAKDLSIDPKLVQTSALEIDLVKPEYYDWRICYETSANNKFGARQMFTYRIRDVSKLTPLLTKALEVGATKVLGVDYRTTKLRQYRDQARSMAIKAARQKAVAMAADLGLGIGKAHTITETPYYGGDWYYYGSWWSRYGSSGYGANAVQNVASSSAPGGTSDDISLGQIAVTARVSVSFELR